VKSKLIYKMLMKDDCQKNLSKKVTQIDMYQDQD